MYLTTKLLKHTHFSLQVTEKYLTRLRHALRSFSSSFDKEDIISSAMVLEQDQLTPLVLWSHLMDEHGAERLQETRLFSPAVVAKYSCGPQDVFIGETL